MSKIIDYLKKPKVYTKSSCKFWDDEHISEQMLKAHLHPEWDAASRNFNFIENSVKWISETAPVDQFSQVLDLGCGPGLYANQLNKLGYQVTGIDFSKRSIEYAKEHNKQNTYYYQNYLDIDYENEFDLIILIYCDYAVLSPSERMILLNKIFKALKKGGKFIFDVFTPIYYKGKTESTNWSLNEEGGFFKPNPHLCLEAHYIYDNNIRLNQFVVIDEKDNIDVFRIWDTYFTKETLTNEIKSINFKNIEFYSDVCGKPYDLQHETMCIVLEK
ncbi:methyltransferase domain-containing protein [Mycoplasmatota bacterium]|nr:methyltransferase domain-containing protein [Mycoplasmatota bacterium]